MSWRYSLQNASFKGVRFDVLDITDDNQRATVDHQYPYVDGADIEDMGMEAHNVSLTAIFWGDSYEGKLKNLLGKLSEKGSGVLVHPVLGRMPDMMALSYRFDHEADYVDYVRFDLTFAKATKGNPIFASTSLFGAIDTILNTVEGFIERVDGVFSRFTGVISEVASFKSRVRGISALVESIRYEFKARINDINGVFNQGSGGSDGSGSSGSRHSFVRDVQMGTQAIIAQTRVVNSAMPLSQYNGVRDIATSIIALPLDVVRGRNISVDLGVPMIEADMPEVQVVTESVVLAELVKEVVELIGDNDELSPPDIEKIINEVRTQAQSTINFIRTQSMEGIMPFAPVFSEYDGFYQLVEDIRQIQHELKKIAETIIAKKPPLIVRLAPFEGTLHQIAHAFYSDYSRFDELLQLNPHLTHPSFIKEGDFINGYTQ